MWKRINKTDRKRLESGKARIYTRGFMDENWLKKNPKKKRYVTVVLN